MCVREVVVYFFFGGKDFCSVDIKFIKSIIMCAACWMDGNG